MTYYIYYINIFALISVYADIWCMQVYVCMSILIKYSLGPIVMAEPVVLDQAVRTLTL